MANVTRRNDMTADRNDDPPKASKGDHAHALVRSGLGAIPFGGTAAVELFNKVVTPPLERRRDEWRESVGERLNSLESARVVDLDELQENDGFVTVVMHASQAALRNHEEEKLDALRNAVLNAALPEPIDHSIQQMFVRYVDELTVWHIRLLRLFQDPAAWFQSNDVTPPTFALSSSLDRLIAAAYPDLGRRGDLWELIASELHTKGLFSGGNLRTMMSADGAFQKRTTDLGDELLRYITEPFADEGG